MSRATFTERASPSTPSTGKASIYVKTDKGIYLKDDAGLESKIALIGGPATFTTLTAGATSVTTLGATTASFSSGASPLPLTLTSTVANGTYFTVKNSGTEIGWIGAAKQVIAGGLSASDFGIAAAAGGTLYLGDLGTATVAIADGSVAITGTTTSSSTIKTSAGGLGVLGTYPSDEANLLSITGASGTATFAAHGSTTGIGNQGTYNFYVVDSAGNNPILPLQLTYAGASVVGYIAGSEQTTPSAPSANGYRIFAQDNGAGKTRLMVIFASGAAQQLAIEP